MTTVSVLGWSIPIEKKLYGTTQNHEEGNQPRFRDSPASSRRVPKTLTKNQTPISRDDHPPRQQRSADAPGRGTTPYQRHAFQVLHLCAKLNLPGALRELVVHARRVRTRAGLGNCPSLAHSPSSKPFSPLPGSVGLRSVLLCLPSRLSCL